MFEQTVEVQLGLGKLAARTHQLQAAEVSVSRHELAVDNLPLFRVNGVCLLFLKNTYRGCSDCPLFDLKIAEVLPVSGRFILQLSRQ